jgi:hypothetical protein
MTSYRFAAPLALALALPIASLVTGSGCSSSSQGADCAASGTITVTVTNQDDVTSNYVCNATVTITPTAGGSASTLKAQGFDGSNANCIYVIEEAPGSYTLNATAPGYEPADPQTIETTCVASSPSPEISLIAIPGETGDAGDDGGDAEGGS